MLLAGKSYDTAWMAQLIRPYLRPDGVLVGFQNGMNEETLTPEWRQLITQFPDRFVLDTDMSYKGTLPLNTSGGQISAGQPGLAGGGLNLVEGVRQMFGDWIVSQCEGDDELVAKVLPTYPPTGKRTLQDNGSWLATLRRPNVDLVRAGVVDLATGE